MTLRRLAAAAFFLLGVALIGAAGWATLQGQPLPFTLTRPPAGADAAKAYAALGGPLNGVEEMKIGERATNKPLARALVVQETGGRLTPLVWTNQVTEPNFFPDLDAADEATALAAIKQHAPQDAAVLAWWDFSRRIRMLAGKDAPLDDPQARGLLVPDAWGGDDALKAARTPWGIGASTADAEKFERFLDALLSTDEDAGARALKDLGGGRPVVLALRLSDLARAAAARPEALQIATQDFPGDVHAAAKAVREWLAERSAETPHAVEPLGATMRLHYLPRRSDAERLLVRLLPFTTSNALALQRLRLVWQFKGYWIYEVTP